MRESAAPCAVLIHGAWQGSWAFDAWRPLLAAAGWRSHAVDLPGNGWGLNGEALANLETYTAHVVQLVQSIDQPVVIVGHSGGGLTASQVAEALPDRVVAAVYLAGMMLPSGMNYLDLVHVVSDESADTDLGGIASWLEWNTDHSASTVRAQGALHCFLHDCEPEVAKHAATLLRAQPETGRDMRNQLSAQGFGRVPRIYVECRDDRSVALRLQRRMQALTPGARCISMACGHVPQLAQPHLLTELLVPDMERQLVAFIQSDRSANG